MNIRIFISMILLLTLTDIFAEIQFEYNKKAFAKKFNSADINKYEKQAKTLIDEFLSSKNITQQDIPTPMRNELNFKKDILIKKLASLDTKKTIDLKNQAITDIVNLLFDEFAQRIEYAKIAAQNKILINAIKEAKVKNQNQPNCSYPDIDKNKRYLLSNKHG